MTLLFLKVMDVSGGYLTFSPIAAKVLKRFGYKIYILIDLFLYFFNIAIF